MVTVTVKALEGCFYIQLLSGWVERKSTWRDLFWNHVAVTSKTSKSLLNHISFLLSCCCFAVAEFRQQPLFPDLYSRQRSGRLSRPPSLPQGRWNSALTFLPVCKVCSYATVTQQTERVQSLSPLNLRTPRQVQITSAFWEEEGLKAVRSHDPAPQSPPLLRRSCSGSELHHAGRLLHALLWHQFWFW